MKAIKFRQAIYVRGDDGLYHFHHWHYWGFVRQRFQSMQDDHLTFVGPETNLSSVQSAFDNSQQYTGIADRHGVEVYAGDCCVTYNPACGQKFEDRHSYKLIADAHLEATIDIERRLRLEVVGNITEKPELREQYANSMA